MKYYADMNDSPVYDLLRQDSINTDNHLMGFSYFSCQYCPDTGRSTGAYIIFYQGGPIDHGSHVTVPVDQSSAKSKYNEACTAVISSAHFMMLIHELLKKDPDIVPEEAPLVGLDSKSYMGMDNNGKYNKHTTHIARRIHFVSNG